MTVCSGNSSRRSSARNTPTRLPSITPRPTLITPVLSKLNPETRINVLHPPTIPRRTVFMETEESQHHMQRRCILMQQRQWLREHGEWQKPYYGTPSIKENYRSNIRSTLKTQMEERSRRRHTAFGEAVNESVIISQRDRLDCMKDAEKRQNRLNFLVSYTKANKQMMEARWNEKKVQKHVENKYDLEQLKFNPINWSHTLK